MNVEQPPYMVIYHGWCNDGTMAAVIFWKMLGARASFHPATPGKPITYDTTGRNVIMVDITGTPADMATISSQCRSLLVLDHHKTGDANCRDVPDSRKVIDMDCCGAMLAWRFANASRDYRVTESADLLTAPYVMANASDAPQLIKYIDARDRFTADNGPDSASIYTLITSIGLSEDKFPELYALFESPVDSLIKTGTVMRARDEFWIAQLVEKSSIKLVRIGREWYVVGICNSAILQSDIGNKLMNANPDVDFAAVWHRNGRHYTASLRSLDTRVAVSTIAETYFAGGGHKNASGGVLFSPEIGTDSISFQRPEGRGMGHRALVLFDSTNRAYSEYYLSKIRPGGVSPAREAYGLDYDPETIVQVSYTHAGVQIYVNGPGAAAFCACHNLEGTDTKQALAPTWLGLEMTASVTS